MSLAASPQAWRIGLIGYGEGGRILAEDLRGNGNAAVSTYDIKLGTAAEGSLRKHAVRHGVALTAAHAALAANTDLLISAVTPNQDVAAAQACAAGIQQGAWFLDFNAASPGAKQRAAEFIDGAGLFGDKSAKRNDWRADADRILSMLKSGKTDA